jgi:RND family efflux transporter MFP subunit
MNAHSIRTLVAPVLIAVAMGLEVLSLAVSVDPQDRPAAAVPPAAAPAVAVAQPVRAAVERELELPVSFLAWETVDLMAKSSGFVKEVTVDLGSLVSAGEALVMLDVPEMQDDLSQAEAVVEAKRAGVEALRAKELQAQGRIESATAELAKAEANLQLIGATTRRTQELFAGKAISEEELDIARNQQAVAEASVQIASASVQAARSDHLAAQAATVVGQAETAIAEAAVRRLRTIMNYATVTAPFDGIVTARQVDRGAFARSAADGGTRPVLTLASTKRLRLALDVPEPEVPAVRIGTALVVTCAALEEPIRTTIARVSGALDPRTRTMRIEADLESPSVRLAPGMYGQARLTLAAGEAALRIPSKAVRSREGKLFVLIAQDGMAKAAPITLGRDDGVRAEVASGLSGDEWVIIEATSAVADGAPVTPRPAGSSPSEQ